MFSSDNTFSALSRLKDFSRTFIDHLPFPIVLMKKSSTIDLVDPDFIDEYFEAVETYVQALATADSLAYQARADFSSTETVSKAFGKEAINIANPKDDYLSQSRYITTCFFFNLQELRICTRICIVLLID